MRTCIGWVVLPNTGDTVSTQYLLIHKVSQIPICNIENLSHSQDDQRFSLFPSWFLRPSLSLLVHLFISSFSSVLRIDNTTRPQKQPNGHVPAVVGQVKYLSEIFEKVQGCVDMGQSRFL
jgi:hypothetical protein